MVIDRKTWMEDLAEFDAQRELLEDEYRGTDGLIYCRKCKTPRQVPICWIVLDGMELNMPCMCDCQTAELRAQRKGMSSAQIEELRDTCFRSCPAAKEWTFTGDDGKTKMMHIAKQYAEHWDDMKRGGRGLLLYGPPGSGKSYMAASIANALTDQGVRCKMTTFAHLDELGKLGAGADDFRQYDLLILDDLDAERDTSYMKEIVYRVIDSRTAERRPLIVTSNTTRNQMRDEKDVGKKRIYSRVCGACVPIEVGGEDRRIAGTAENSRRLMEQLRK